MDDVIGLNGGARKQQIKGSHVMAEAKGDLIRLPFVWDAVQNVDLVVCICVKRHQSAARWIIFGGICTFCNMLMRKAAKARLPGERRKDGEGKKMEGAEWKREKQTEARVNYGCNLRFPREKERQRETSSHAYQITHLPHFLIMVREQAHIQSGLFVRAWNGVRALVYSSVLSCVQLCCAVRRSRDLTCHVCLKLFWLSFGFVHLQSRFSASFTCIVSAQNTRMHECKSIQLWLFSCLTR